MKLVFVLLLTMFTQLKPLERQVLLFYTDSGKEVWDKQKRELSGHESGIMERDILVKSFHMGSTKDPAIREWNIDPTKKFTFILVGRDRGEKFRSGEVVTADQLFALIDAMPMRKNEIRRSRESHN